MQRGVIYISQSTQMPTFTPSTNSVFSCSRQRAQTASTIRFISRRGIPSSAGTDHQRRLSRHGRLCYCTRGSSWRASSGWNWHRRRSWGSLPHGVSGSRHTHAFLSPPRITSSIILPLRRKLFWNSSHSAITWYSLMQSAYLVNSSFRSSVMVASSFSSFRLISWSSSLYSLQDEVSYSADSILPYQNSSKMCLTTDTLAFG